MNRPRSLETLRTRCWDCVGPPTTGLVCVGDATSAPRRLTHCALMPQGDLLLPWRTALDNAAIALKNRGVSRAEARQRTPAVRAVRVGQFVAGKDILLLDEPFGALDSITRAQMQEWLVQAMEAVPRTVLLVTHDVEEALLLSQRVVVVSERPGRLVRVIDAGHHLRGFRREIVTSPEFVGYGIDPKLVIVALVCFFPIVIIANGSTGAWHDAVGGGVAARRWAHGVMM